MGRSLADKNKGSPVFIDVSLRDSSAASIRKFFGDSKKSRSCTRRAASGKVRPVNVDPCEQVALGEIYFKGKRKPKLKLMP